MPLSVPNPREKPEKTSDSLDNLRIEEINMDGGSEATLERVPCIQYPTTYLEKSVPTQKASESEQALLGYFSML